MCLISLRFITYQQSRHHSQVNLIVWSKSLFWSEHVIIATESDNLYGYQKLVYSFLTPLLTINKTIILNFITCFISWLRLKKRQLQIKHLFYSTSQSWYLLRTDWGNDCSFYLSLLGFRWQNENIIDVQNYTYDQ